MIERLTREIAAIVQARHAVAFAYGRKRFPAKIPTQDEIVVREDDEGGRDVFSAPGTTRSVQSSAWSCSNAVRVDILARASSGGSAEQDEKARLRVLRDAFLCALQRVAHASLKCTLGQVTGQWVPPDGDASRQLGARYELTFQIVSAVLEPAASTADENTTPGLTVIVDADVDETATAPAA